MQITLYDIASRFVGLREVQGTASSPQILAMLRLDEKWPEGDEVPWCSAALNYWAWLLRLPRSKSLMARSWLDIGTPIAFPMQMDEKRPSVGFDIVVLRREKDDGKSGHVGLFAGWEDFQDSYYSEADIKKHPDKVLILGGNQNDAVSIQRFPVDRILGIRRLLDE